MTKVVYTLWVKTDLSVTIYIEESSLSGHNLFLPTSNLCYLNLAQVLKT